MRTQKEIDAIKKQRREQEIFNFRLLAMGDVLSDWATSNTPDRERLAFKDGFFEGFQAARKYFEEEAMAREGKA